MAGQQRGRRPQSQRGDFTGNKKAQLAQENADAVEARRQELGIVTEQTKAIKDEGVIDLMDGQPRLEHPDLEPDQEVLIDTAAREPGVREEKTPAPEGTKLQSTTGPGTIEVFELEEERPQAAMAANEVLTKEAMNEPTIIRALYDLEDITIGYGNTHTFREGYRYKVPRWVAAHLEEKQLCIVLSLNPV